MTDQLRQLGPYNLQQLLGFNGVFASYQGIDNSTQLPALVVTVAKGEIVDPQVWAVFIEDVSELIQAGGNRLCRPYNFGEEGDYYWAAFEWIQGSHLGMVVRDHGLPDYATTFQWMAMLAEALAALHRKGVIHRCLSPASIFIDNKGDVRLLHSCWSILLLYTHTGLASPAMTSILPFVAPEILAGENGDEAADVYSLGANLYFLLTGQPVHWHEEPGELARLAVESAPDFTILPEEFPAEGRDILEEILAKDPQDRPVNLPALIDRLRAIVDVLIAPPQEQGPVDQGGAIDADYGVMAHDGATTPEDQGALPPLHDQSDGQPEQPQYRPPSVADLPRGATAGTGSSSVELSQIDPREERLGDPHQPRIIEESEPPKKSGGLAKMLIGGGIGALILVGALVFGLNLFGGSSVDQPTTRVAEPAVRTTEPAVTPAQPREPAAPEEPRVDEALLQKYRLTARRLRDVGTMMIVYRREKGLEGDQWPASIADLSHLGTPEEFLDAWDNKMELRGSYVLSAGADGRFDNDDDVWFDAATGRPGGYSPTLSVIRR